MRHSLPPVPQAFIWRQRVMVIAVLALLGGCGTTNGDFGEVRSTLVSDNVHDWVGPYASDGIRSKFDLTDDERQLRDLAYPLIESPYNRQQWYSVLGERGYHRPDRGTFDHATYATRLLASRYHSPSARYAQLSDDINNDTTRMPQFFETAGRVLDIDQKRQKSLAYVSAITPVELKDAQRRMRENESLIALVSAKLTQRESSYRFALERLIIKTPMQQAVEVERAIGQMHALIERYRSPAPTWVREQNLATVR